MPVLNPSRAKHVALVAQKLVTEKLVIPNRIGLYELPNLVTPGDIRRALGDKMRGVENVQLEYKAFRPTGKAVITMTRPEFVQENLRHLKPLSICGTRVQSVAQYGVESANAPRMRGVRGLEQAVERGVIDGNGLDGNFPNVTRNVVLWGLPGKTTAEEVGRAMGSSGEYKPGTKNGKPIVIKIDRPNGKFTLFSRFIVTMSSVSEARRLVRAWHMTPWITHSPDLIRAQVLH